jgi:hypothetical protein
MVISPCALSRRAELASSEPRDGTLVRVKVRIGIRARVRDRVRARVRVRVRVMG